ncbi:MAG: PD-(D/E)XK nuclease family transposase [Desulfamplus sp.]|nr:PD-(D/E)XK nuclease family transposase [Desulfamplus sp.]
MPYIKPTSDIFIKYLLGTEEHKDLLLSFINAVLARSLYYWAKLYSSQLNEGNKYITLFPVVCINILEFEMFRQFEKYHSTFVLRDIKE